MPHANTRRSVLALVLAFSAPTGLSAQDASIFGFTNSGAGCATVLRLDLAGGSVDIAASARGWYRSSGFNNGRSETANYIASSENGGAYTNNWFQFDLFNFGGADILGASLHLDNPVTSECHSTNGLDVRPSQVGFNSASPTETFSLFDVSTPLSSLGIAGDAGIFEDLRSGVLFGQRVVSAADNGTSISVSLNSAAFAELLNARGSSIAFGGTIVPGAVVPEPSSSVLLGCGLFSLALALRKRRASGTTT